MAIQISRVTVIQNDQRATLKLVNFGTYNNNDLVLNVVRGKAVGDTVYNRQKEYTMSWLGSSWTNSVAGYSVNVSSFSTTTSFPTPTNCSTISAFSCHTEVVAGVRNCPGDVSDQESYTFMATLKFENPEAELWAAWSSQSDDVFTNLVGKRDRNDFSDFFFPDGYSQKQLTVTGDDGDKYYTNDISNQTHINWKSLVYGPPSAFNALNVLYQSPEFASLKVSRFSGNFNIKYNKSTAKYFFERTYYNDSNQALSSYYRIPSLDANGDKIVNSVSQPTGISNVYLGFLGSAKNGNIFDLIEAKKEVNYDEGQTLSWQCPEGKSLVGFFYVVKNLEDGISISQALKINPDEVDRASYLQGQEGVGNVIECKPGMDLNITIGNFDENGMLEYYPAPENTSWSLRYAVWSVSN